MSKNIELDKFYTPTRTAEKCVELMLNTITNRMFVTEYLEPSAGSGNFSNIINGCIAYDIEPQHETIIKALSYLPDDYKLLIFGSQHPMSIQE